MNTIDKPHGIFPAQPNFMTPSILAYFKLREGYAELSEGAGMNGEPIFGVTVRPDPHPKRSKLCYSEREALDYIEEMS
jgi:hypothetical protein